MFNKISNQDLLSFSQILEENDFTKEEFLFNSVPYISGMKRIINITQNIINNSSSNILDLGCGTGLTSYFLSKNASQVIGIDVFEADSTQFHKNNQMAQKKLWNSLSNSKNNLKFKFYDGSKIPFKTKSFDLVFLHAVFEHITPNNRSFLLREIYRVLKTSGYLVIARTPNKYALTEFLAKSHEFKFTKKELLSYFDNHKYKTIHYKKTDFFPEIGPNKFFQNLINTLYPVLGKIDNFINETPLEVLSHHHFLILKKH